MNWEAKEHSNTLLLRGLELKNSIRINAADISQSITDLCLCMDNIHRFDDYSYAHKELYSNDLNSNADILLS